MRKFVVSDLHGNGEVYDSIMAYLENIALVEDVELYINGDLIDRGIDSYRMLEDVYNRIVFKEGNIKINYLGGNHELMMYQELGRRKKDGSIRNRSDWIRNGGSLVKEEIEKQDNMEEVCLKYKSFLGNLNIYHKFAEKILGNNILLVHAQAPRKIEDNCHMKIADNNISVERAVWTREKFDDLFLALLSKYGSYNKIGKKGFLTIIGHNPVNNEKGFKYISKKNYINIDGGCSAYANGDYSYDHVPLLEIEDGRISIIVFNHNNEIIDGYIIDDDYKKMSMEELDKKRIFINNDLDNSYTVNKGLVKRNR